LHRIEEESYCEDGDAQCIVLPRSLSWVPGAVANKFSGMTQWHSRTTLEPSFPPDGYVILSPTIENQKPKPILKGPIHVNVYKRLTNSSLCCAASLSPPQNISNVTESGEVVMVRGIGVSGEPQVFVETIRPTCLTLRFRLTCNAIHEALNCSSQHLGAEIRPKKVKPLHFKNVCRLPHCISDYELHGSKSAENVVLNIPRFTHPVLWCEKHPAQIGVVVDKSQRVQEPLVPHRFFFEPTFNLVSILPSVLNPRVLHIYESSQCRSAVHKIFLKIPKDAMGMVDKLHYISFILDLCNIYFPCYHTKANVELAEDEWLCRGTCGKVSFVTFFDTMFRYAFVICREQSMTEEQFIEFWDFSYHVLHGSDDRVIAACAGDAQSTGEDQKTEKIRRITLQIPVLRSDCNYKRYRLLQMLSDDPQFVNVSPARKPLLLFRKVEEILSRQGVSEKRANPPADPFPISSTAEEDEQFDFPSLNLQQKRIGEWLSDTSVQKLTDKQKEEFRRVQDMVAIEKCSSGILLHEDVFEPIQITRDDIDDLLDYMSDLSDGALEREPLRDKYEQHRQRLKSQLTNAEKGGTQRKKSDTKSQEFTHPPQTGGVTALKLRSASSVHSDKAATLSVELMESPKSSIVDRGWRVEAKTEHKNVADSFVVVAANDGYQSPRRSNEMAALALMDEFSPYADEKAQRANQRADDVRNSIHNASEKQVKLTKPRSAPYVPLQIDPERANLIRLQERMRVQELSVVARQSFEQKSKDTSPQRPITTGFGMRTSLSVAPFVRPTNQLLRTRTEEGPSSAPKDAQVDLKEIAHCHIGEVKVASEKAMRLCEHLPLQKSGHDDILRDLDILLAATVEPEKGEAEYNCSPPSFLSRENQELFAPLICSDSPSRDYVCCRKRKKKESPLSPPVSARLYTPRPPPDPLAEVVRRKAEQVSLIDPSKIVDHVQFRVKPVRPPQREALKFSLRKQEFFFRANGNVIRPPHPSLGIVKLLQLGQLPSSSGRRVVAASPQPLGMGVSAARKVVAQRNFCPIVVIDRENTTPR
jgi:hypothetical protein